MDTESPFYLYFPTVINDWSIKSVVKRPTGEYFTYTWKRHNCQLWSGTGLLRLMLDSLSDLYHTKPAVTWNLGFSCPLRRTLQINHHLQQAEEGGSEGVLRPNSRRTLPPPPVVTYVGWHVGGFKTAEHPHGTGNRKLHMLPVDLPLHLVQRVVLPVRR